MKSVRAFALLLLLSAPSRRLSSLKVSRRAPSAGVVKDQQGLAVPGATITATSPALQGARTTVTDAEGNYSLTGAAALAPTRCSSR